MGLLEAVPRVLRFKLEVHPIINTVIHEQFEVKKHHINGRRSSQAPWAYARLEPWRMLSNLELYAMTFFAIMEGCDAGFFLS